MKKLLLSLSLFCVGITQAQSIYTYGFNSVSATMLGADGWSQTNQSVSPSTAVSGLWRVPAYVAPTTSSQFGSTSPSGQAGGLNSFAIVNYQSTTAAGTTGGTISNWLISPSVTVQNGDVVSFWTRKGTDGATDYPDRLELRMSTDGTTVVPSTGATDIGSFTTLGATVNPTLAAGFVYSQTWSQYSFIVSGLTGLTNVKFAFRYFVTDGGTNGNNSDLIGIDTFLVDRPLGVNNYLSSNFSVYPNPANNVINISNSLNAFIDSVVLTDLNGRVIKTQKVNATEGQINISDLATGIYMMNVTTDQGTAIKKVIKE